MEIERKYRIRDIRELPYNPEDYPHRSLEQAYLCTEPVVRVRRDGDSYWLTYKSAGLMAREEYNLPLTAESYAHLLAKADGRVICKERYVIPISNALSLELDIFRGDLARLILAEIEFPDLETAEAYTAPDWLSDEVTFSKKYHNSSLSLCPPEDLPI